MTNLFQPVAPIKVEAPQVSLLTVARTLPNGTEWRSGISHLPNGCSPAAGWPNCEVDPAPPNKCAPQFPGAANFAPWLFYVPDGCDLAPFYAEDWERRSSEALAAYTPWAMSLELDTGALSGNPSLRSTAVDLTGAGAIDVVNGIGALIRARVEAGFGGMATLHVPAWLIPAFEDHYLLDNSTGAMSGAMVRVSPGPGYTGVSPDSTLNIVPGPGEGWLYITGPVEYELGPIEVYPKRDQQQHLTNTVEVYAERAGILRFDPCGVFAVRVNGTL